MISTGLPVVIICIGIFGAFSFGGGFANISKGIYGIAFAGLMEEPVRNLIGNGSDATVLLIQTLISTLLILLTAEFLPKTVFRINPNNSLRLIPVWYNIFIIS